METLWGDVGEGSQKNQLELIQAKLETSKKNKPGVIPSFQAMLDPLGIQPSLNQRILQGKTFLQAKYRVFPLSNPIYWSLFLPKVFQYPFKPQQWLLNNPHGRKTRTGKSSSCTTTTSAWRARQPPPCVRGALRTSSCYLGVGGAGRAPPRAPGERENVGSNLVGAGGGKDVAGGIVGWFGLVGR